MATTYGDDAERLWGKFHRADSGCWIWSAYIAKTGYGQVLRAGKPTLAHR